MPFSRYTVIYVHTSLIFSWTRRTEKEYIFRYELAELIVRLYQVFPKNRKRINEIKIINKI